MLTGMEKRMYDAQKHRVKITTDTGDIFTGLCTMFTSAYDNDSEEASLLMKDPLKNGMPFVGEYVELEVHEILEIEYLDGGK